MADKLIYYVSKIARGWGITKTQVLDIINELGVSIHLDESKQRNKEYIFEEDLEILVQEFAIESTDVPVLDPRSIKIDTLKESAGNGATTDVVGIDYFNHLLSKSSTELSIMHEQAMEDIDRLRIAMDIMRTQVAELELTKELETICGRLEKAGMNSQRVIDEALARARDIAAKAPASTNTPQKMAQFFAPTPGLQPPTGEPPKLEVVAQQPKEPQPIADSEAERQRILEDAQRKLAEAETDEVVTYGAPQPRRGGPKTRLNKDPEFGNIASSGSLIL